MEIQRAQYIFVYKILKMNSFYYTQYGKLII